MKIMFHQDGFHNEPHGMIHYLSVRNRIVERLFHKPVLPAFPKISIDLLLCYKILLAPPRRCSNCQLVQGSSPIQSHPALRFECSKLFQMALTSLGESMEGYGSSVGGHARSVGGHGRSWEVSGRSWEVSGRSWDISGRSLGGLGR